MKVLVCKEINKEAFELIKKEFAEAEYDPLEPEDRFIERIRDAEALFVRSKPKVTSKVIESAKKLKVIARAGVGLDNIDVEAAKKKGIKVINTPEATSISVAELAIGLMLSLLRKIPFSHNSVKSGKWERSKFLGAELHGKKLGIIGFGRIGKAVAERAKAFGLEILVYDPYVDMETCLRYNVKRVELTELLKTCDIISLHMPSTPETKGMIGKKEFDSMKLGAYLINTARAELIQQEYLLEALKNKLAGAAFDVYVKEPPANDPLLNLDNVVFTSHLGASTQEGQERAIIEAINKVKEELK